MRFQGPQPVAPAQAPVGRIAGETFWKKVAVLIVLAVPVFGLIAIGILDFETWQQVDDLWAFRFTLEQLGDHPHYYRYLVIYPGFLASEVGGQIMISLYIGLFCIAGLFIVREVTLPRGLLCAAIAMALYFLPHFFMNGRGAISWAAWALGILVLLRAERRGWRWRDVPFAAAAMLGSATSTGVFAVAFGAFFASQFYGLFRQRGWLTFLILLLPVGYFASFFYVAIEKNLTYFEDGNNWAIINMLDHGWGRLIEQSRGYATAAVIVGTLSPFVIYFLAKRLTVHEAIILVAPVVGGAFGFTTLTLIVPSVAMALVPKLIGTRTVRSPAAFPAYSYRTRPT